MSLLLTLAAALLALVAGLAAFTAWTAARVEQALPARGRFVDVDGARVHVLEAGAGPTLLLVHGLAGQSGHFTHSLAERLARDFHVVAIDRPGAGWSRRARGASARLRDQARLVAGVISTLKLDRPLLVGHSLGGGIGLAVGLDHPDIVRGLALIAPLTQVEEKPPAVFRALWIRSPLLRTLTAWTVAAPAFLLRSRSALAEVFGPEPPPADFATRGGGLLGLRPASFRGACEDLVAARDDLPGMVARYPSLRLPVSVLFGAEDRILDAQKHGAALRALIPGAKVEIVPGGHMLPLTQPELTADFVRRAHARSG